MSTSSKPLLHGMKASTCTRRAVLTFAETGTDYDFHLVFLPKGEHKQPEYMKMQPFGQIPVLQHDGATIFESRAVMRYIAGKFDSTGKLYPSDLKQRALVDQWISVETSHFHYCDEIVGELMFVPMRGGKSDQSKVDELTKKLDTTMEILNRHLEHNKFFTGNNFTVADIAYIPYTDYLIKTDAFKNYLDKYPNFKRWWGDVTSRDSYKKMASDSEFAPKQS